MLKIIELLCQLPNPFSEQFDSRVCQFIFYSNIIIIYYILYYIILIIIIINNNNNNNNNNILLWAKYEHSC